MSQTESQTQASNHLDIDKVFGLAAKKNVKVKIGLGGVSGSGKTMTALKIAYGLTKDWGQILVIDTENGSAKLYANNQKFSVGQFRHYDLKAPYHPERFIKGLELAQSFKLGCVIIDSITHEWEGTGGCLDLHQKAGGRWNDWKDITPLHEKFLQSVVNADCHVICTMRKATDWQVSEENGKKKIEKLGLKNKTREGFDYELTVSFDMNMQHNAIASKDRTGLFSSQIPFEIGEKTGEILSLWANDELKDEHLKI